MAEKLFWFLNPGRF